MSSVGNPAKPPRAEDMAATEENDRKRRSNNEKITRLVTKVVGVLAEIERFDKEVPVGMGGGVNAFLEGFLEEVLVRVEAEDEVDATK